MAAFTTAVQSRVVEMGNTIKNYEKKKRKQRRETQRKIRKIVHDVMIEGFGFSNLCKEKYFFDDIIVK
jgi:hypothetical protein